MTYGDIRELALHLIGRKSIAGTDIPLTYNNQQDYVDKIPGLIDAAQINLATTARKISAFAMLSDLDREKKNDMFIYTCPDDLFEMKGNGILVPVADTYERFTHVRFVDDKHFMVPNELPRKAYIEYYRYPTLPETRVWDDDGVLAAFELDNTKEAQAIVPYYVAAQLIIDDDAFQYASFYNEFEARKAALIKPQRAEISTVKDVYGLDVLENSYLGW